MAGWHIVSMRFPGAETLDNACRAPAACIVFNWENSEMAAKGSRLFLVKSAPEKTVDQPRFRTDEIVPQSGIYKVRHRKHRLPHEVSLFRDQKFPRCAQCQNAVVFELLRAVRDEAEAELLSSRICLYELPVLEDNPLTKDTPIAG
jgi:hypothetical protein